MTATPKRSTWRSYLRSRVGESGERIIDTLVELMEGVPVAQRTADGRFVDPIIPTPATRLDAAKHLSEILHGRAASQTEQVQAEESEAEREAIRALSDFELERRLAGAKPLPELEEGVLVSRAPDPLVPKEFDSQQAPATFDVRAMARAAWESREDD